MRGNLYLGAMALCLGLLPISEALACSWDLNGVGYPASCGYRGRGGGGGGGYVAPAPYVPPPPSPAQIAAQQARPINDAGIRAEKAGNFDLAVSLFEQAVRLSPGDSILVNNLRHARAVVINVEALEAEKAGNFALALSLFEQALRVQPTEISWEAGRATLRKNIKQARERLEEQQGREKQMQQDKIAAAKMQESVHSLAQSLTPTSGGLDFNDAKPGSKPEQAGGLPFMASNPAAAGNPGQTNNGAPPGSAVQLNPGAKFETAPETKVVGAVQSGSVREQLFNSPKESTGQLFDNGRGHDDVSIDARLPNPATPSAQSPDARFAKNKDYQAAAMELAKTQIAAETLNKKMATLLEQQKASPTPEGQTEIYNLSGQLHEAGGAVAIATNKVETVKKKIIQEGPAIVVDDGAPAAGPSEPASASK